MDPTLLLFLTLLGYGLALILQLLSLTRPIAAFPVFLLGTTACAAQGWLLYQWIDGINGQNLTYVNVFAMATWLNGLMTLAMGLHRPLRHLTVLSFPLAMGTTLFAWVLPGKRVLQTAGDPWELMHILLAVLAISLLCLAALQAILLFFQQRLLRRGTCSAFIRESPCLETNEHVLFTLVGLGSFLLGTVWVLGMVAFSSFTEPTFRWRAVAAVSSWLIFAVLLLGRFFLGWRGRVAIRWTLVGSSLMLLSYCVSHWLR